MLAPIEVPAAPAVKLCPRCHVNPCASRNEDYCAPCAAALNRQWRAARKAAVMSGAVKWQCIVCGCTDLAFFLDYSPRCKVCHNLHTRQIDRRNTLAYRESSQAQAEARTLDPQAAALVSIPAEWEKTQERINRLCDERLRLWLKGAWVPMSSDDRERCEAITTRLVAEWDNLRRQIAAMNFRPENRRRERETGYENRPDLRIG